MKRIFVSGVARSGKNEFAKQATKFFNLKGLKCKEFALANQLKHEIDSLAYYNFGIDIFDCTPEEKEIIRPIMVAYGCAKRKVSKGKYWVNFVENQLQYEEENTDTDIAIITDIRFAEYEDDEAFWACQTGNLIHITRILPSGEILQPANEEERVNDPKVYPFAKYTSIIPTMEPDELYTHVSGILEYYKEIWQ